MTATPRARSACAWSCISAISGEMTRVVPGEERGGKLVGRGSCRRRSARRAAGGRPRAASRSPRAGPGRNSLVAEPRETRVQVQVHRQVRRPPPAGRVRLRGHPSRFDRSPARRSPSADLRVDRVGSSAGTTGGAIRRSKRNTEIIRQWRILRSHRVGSRRHGQQAGAMSEGVATATIRRDLVGAPGSRLPALRTTPADAGPHYWRLSGRPLGKLNDTAFTLAELCAFYANRTRLRRAARSPIDADLESAHGEGRARAQPAHEDVPRPTRARSSDVQAGAGAEARSRRARAHEASSRRWRGPPSITAAVEMDYHSFRSRQGQDVHRSSRTA